jgi:hypothetical protein
MRPKPIFGNKHFVIILSITSLFLLSIMNIRAQIPANFSGKWEFDKSKSDKEEVGDASFNGTIILEIKQNSTIITFEVTFILPGKKGIVMPADTFFVDGKVITDNRGTGPAKKFAKWTSDKKILTTNYLMTDSVDGVSQEFLTALTYKLSDEGKTLIIEEFHKSNLNGEKTIKKVYKKKI